MAAIQPITLDFETMPIQTRPHYPPVPVSFSLKLPGMRKPEFYAWGHLTGGNNCSLKDAKHALSTAYKQVTPETPLLCHNAKFDLDVAETHFTLPLPNWDRYHDTMFLLFLYDPHQRSLGLKQSAERLFNLPPDERDTVKEWLLENKKQLEADFPEIVTLYGGIKPSTAGAFIAYAPGHIVGPYANGDVSRTEKIFKAVYKEVVVDMRAAYERELRLMPILLNNEREGIRTDEAKMASDQAMLEKSQLKVDDWIRKAIKAPGLDLNQDNEMAKALEAADAISEWTLTATGRKSVSKANMKLSHFRDKKLAAAYSYRQRCATMLETFIRPWQHFSVKGRMHTTWNQVRQSKQGGSTGGTRTGRPSTDTPNFLNMPKAVENSEQTGFMMPTHIRDLAPLPRIRSYIIPDAKNHMIGRRDYNQQELRILAHFEDGALLQAYLENPRLDVHEFARATIAQMLGLELSRSFVKTLNFGYVYGQGIGSLAEKLDRAVDEVKQARNAQMKALPGLDALNKDIKSRGRAGQFITTWGGRQYYVEPPVLKDGRMMSFEYKLLNYLIQGSAADVTKEAIIRYNDVRKDGRLILTVYDEIDISAPKGAIKKEMLLLREAMMSIELDVPLISDGEIGINLGNLDDLKEPAPDLSRWIN